MRSAPIVLAASLAMVASIVAAALSSEVDAAELGILVAQTQDGHVMQKADAAGRAAPVFSRLRSGTLHDRLEAEAARGFTADMLALDETAQRTAGATSIRPTWLYLSSEEGGYARTGFWLSENGKFTYLDEPFVDLVVDEASIADGEFEEIFAHELGHVFLRRLIPNLPAGYSRAPHGSLTVTDDPTAFDEGFAIHYQALARAMTRNQRLRDEDFGLDAKPFVSYWLSNIDRAARIEGVRRNWFAQNQLPMSGEGDPVALRDQSTLFDPISLKSGDQMLASEGLIATLFFRWLAPGAVDRSTLLERYSHAFSALALLGRRALHPDSRLFLELIDAERALFPEDGRRLTELFLDVTYGATADVNVARQTEKLASYGRIGDAEKFTSGLKNARESLRRLTEAVIDSSAKLNAALGPDIWLLTDATVASDGPAGHNRTHQSVNLNTAEIERLLTLPELDRASAERALRIRRRDGPFVDLSDFVKRVGVGAAVALKLGERADALRKEGTYARR